MLKCVLLNFSGKISVTSVPISSETRGLKEGILQVLSGDTSNLKDKAYDKFNLTLENMQILVALNNENWRRELDKEKSCLFLLTPTTVKVVLQMCLVKQDPTMPEFKIKGSLDDISINISDYRLVKLAQILDSLVESEHLDSTGSNLMRTGM